MQFKLKNVRSLIKEVLSESNRYFGLSSAGGLQSPAFNRVGPDPNRPQDVADPIDEVALKEKILSIFLSISDIPQNSENSYSDTCGSIAR